MVPSMDNDHNENAPFSPDADLLALVAAFSDALREDPGTLILVAKDAGRTAQTIANRRARGDAGQKARDFRGRELLEDRYPEPGRYE